MDNLSEIVVSTFHCICDTKDHEGRKRCTAGHVINAIQTNEVIAKKIDYIRSIHDDKQRKAAKRELLPVVMWQGIFSERSNDGCISLSSLVCIDIDHKSEAELDMIRNTIVQWPFVYAFFRSPSGDGLKVVVKTDNCNIANYSNCYRQVEQLFIDTFGDIGIKPDNSCEDVGRACYMSHDPNPYCNASATSWHYEYKPEFDKVSSSDSSSTSQGNYVAPVLSPGEMFMAKLNAARCPLNDEQIIEILDRKFMKYKVNYTDGHRTKSVFVQAKTLCEAGVDESKAINYLKTRFLPTGFDERKLEWEARRAYEKTGSSFGVYRGNYKSYSEYKSSH